MLVSLSQRVQVPPEDGFWVVKWGLSTSLGTWTLWAWGDVPRGNAAGIGGGMGHVGVSYRVYVLVWLFKINPWPLCLEVVISLVVAGGSGKSGSLE